MGKVIPKLIAVFFLLDVVLRFLPMHVFAYRGWEVMLANRPGFGHFDVNRFYSSSRTYGDLSHFGNLPSIRDYRPETFTTDACGNRNPPDWLKQSDIQALLVGSSFSAGCGLSDDQTLSARLSHDLKAKVYNAAGHDLDPLWVRALAHKLGIKPGSFVIAEYLEKTEDFIPKPDEKTLSGPHAEICVPGPPETIQKKISHLWNDFFYFSPLKVIAQDLVKRLKNDVILPNSSRENVQIIRLKNGEQMLVLPDEVKDLAKNRSETHVVEQFKKVAASLKEDGLNLQVFLVPNKYTIYGTVTSDPYLAKVEQGLVAASIKVLNLEPIFRKAAAQALPNSRYLYWRDDTHWNALGVNVAAQSIAHAITEF